MNSKGPRTEPWGTPQEDVYQEDRLLSHLSMEAWLVTRSMLEHVTGGQTGDLRILCGQCQFKLQIKPPILLGSQH